MKRGDQRAKDRRARSLALAVFDASCREQPQPLSMASRGHLGGRVCDSSRIYLGDSPVPVLRDSSGRRARLRCLGAADRRWRLGGPGSVLPSTPVSVLPGNDLFDRRTRFIPRPYLSGDDWRDRMRTPRTCRTSSSLRKGGTVRGAGACHLRTSHILRRVASEIRPRRVFHVPRALASEWSPRQSGHTIALVFVWASPSEAWPSPARTGLS